MKLLRKDITANRKFSTYFVLDAMELKVSTKKDPYLVLNLSDRSGAIKGYLWDNPDRMAGLLREKTFVKVRGEAREISGALIINVKRIRTAIQGEIEIYDFPVTAPFGQLSLFHWRAQEKGPKNGSCRGK
jgi:3'-5' exoribonuclease